MPSLPKQRNVESYSYTKFSRLRLGERISKEILMLVGYVVDDDEDRTSAIREYNTGTGLLLKLTTIQIFTPDMAKIH
jgi:hypothetical protein